MKRFDQILTQLESDLSSDIPALLSAQTLDDFAEYSIGGSREPRQISLHIYQDNVKLDDETNAYTAIIQLQLYQVKELASAKYTEVVTGYMKSYDPQRLGMNILQNIDVDTWPIEQNKTTFVYVECTWLEMLDSCDQ